MKCRGTLCDRPNPLFQQAQVLFLLQARVYLENLLFSAPIVEIREGFHRYLRGSNSCKISTHKWQGKIVE